MYIVIKLIEREHNCVPRWFTKKPKSYLKNNKGYKNSFLMKKGGVSCEHLSDWVVNVLVPTSLTVGGKKPGRPHKFNFIY